MRELRLGGLSGLLLALSFPPLPFPLLAFAALAPLAMALERLPSGPGSGPGALRGGVACGAIAWGLLLHWVPGALFPVAPWSALPLFALVVAALALLSGAVARLALLFRTRGVPLVAGLPLLWVLGEWLRSAWPGVEVAWLPLGNALVTVPALAAPAEWVGVLGLSGWAALAGTVAGVHLARWGGGERFPGPAVLVLLLLPGAAGWIRDLTLVTSPVLGVAALQFQAPGSPGRPPSGSAMQAALAPWLASPPGPRQGVHLLLLPEGTLPSNRPVSTGLHPGPQPGADTAGDSTDLTRILAAGAARAGVPLVAGGYAVGGEDQGPWNVALAMDPRGGEGLEVVHRKRHLVPGIEGGSPLLSRWLAPLGPGREGRPPVPGRDPGELMISGRSLGILICYESAFSRAVRRSPPGEVEAFLALTHEGWFGEPGGSGAVPRGQHIAHLRMRAVESRSGIVRSAADGEALFVDPRGQVAARGGAGWEGWLVGQVEGAEGRSLHTVTPPLLLPGGVVLLLLGLILAGQWRGNGGVGGGGTRFREGHGGEAS